MREKKKGKPVVVSIGYGSNKGKKKKTIMVSNVNDLKKVKDHVAVIASVGLKKKIEIAKKAKEKKIKISNLNIDKFLKTAEKKFVPKIKTEENKK